MYKPDLSEYRRDYESYQKSKTEKDKYGYLVWEYVYDPDEEGIKVYYGDIKHNPEGKYLEVPFCTFSDYSGCTVERSNQRVFMEMFKDIPGVYPLYGGYSTTGVLIKYSLYEENEEIQETINSLFDYPLIDEEDMSNLEMEIEDESWDSWIKSDLISELEKNEIPYDEDKLRELFWENCQYQNVYPLFETAISCWYDIEEIVEKWITGNELWSIYVWDYEGFPIRKMKEVTSEEMLKFCEENNIEIRRADLWKNVLCDNLIKIIKETN